MMTNSKMTNKVALNAVLNSSYDFSATIDGVSFTDEQVREKLTAMLESINKPVERKVDIQKQNEMNANREMVLNVLFDGKERTVGEILAEVSVFKEMNYTPQKVTAVMRSLLTDNMIIKKKVGNKMYYQTV